MLFTAPARTSIWGRARRQRSREFPAIEELREGAGAPELGTAGPTRVRVGTPSMCIPPGTLSQGSSSALRRSPGARPRSPGGDEGGARAAEPRDARGARGPPVPRGHPPAPPPHRAPLPAAAATSRRRRSARAGSRWGARALSGLDLIPTSPQPFLSAFLHPCIPSSLYP